MTIKISGVSSYFPKGTLTNDDLNKVFPDWSVERISDKTGIYNRHIASDDEFSSTLGIAAANKLLANMAISVVEIDYLIVVTQTPDFILPGIAPQIHSALGMNQSAGAIDLNLGCSGFVYALGLAKGLIESRQATKILLVTSDTYTKLLHSKDKTVRTIFGDGATATLVEKSENPNKDIYAFVYGTDGNGAGNLVVPNGGLRNASNVFPKSSLQARGLDEERFGLYMNGPEIFNFTIRVAGEAVQEILDLAKIDLGDVDYFVFHQANKFMLDHLRDKIGIPENRFAILMGDSGNTVSGTIPMALEKKISSGSLEDKKILLLGFGVGLSWAGCLVDF